MHVLAILHRATLPVSIAQIVTLDYSFDGPFILENVLISNINCSSVQKSVRVPGVERAGAPELLRVHHPRAVSEAVRGVAHRPAAPHQLESGHFHKFMEY